MSKPELEQTQLISPIRNEDLLNQPDKLTETLQHPNTQPQLQPVQNVPSQIRQPYLVPLNQNFQPTMTQSITLPQAPVNVKPQPRSLVPTYPFVKQPVVTQPVATQPVVAQPVVTQPVAQTVAQPLTQSVVAKPVAQQVVAQPVTQSAVAQPVTQSVVAQPFAVQQSQIFIGEVKKTQPYLETDKQIQGERDVQYIPKQRYETEYYTEDYYEYVPVTKQIEEYYAVKKDFIYTPQVEYETYIEYIPNKKVYEDISYVAQQTTEMSQSPVYSTQAYLQEQPVQQTVQVATTQVVPQQQPVQGVQPVQAVQPQLVQSVQPVVQAVQPQLVQSVQPQLLQSAYRQPMVATVPRQIPSVQASYNPYGLPVNTSQIPNQLFNQVPAALRTKSINFH